MENTQQTGCETQVEDITNCIHNFFLQRNFCKFGWFGLVYLFILSVTYVCNIGHANYRLKFTAQLIIYGHPHNTI